MNNRTVEFVFSQFTVQVFCIYMFLCWVCGEQLQESQADAFLWATEDVLAGKYCRVYWSH